MSLRRIAGVSFVAALAWLLPACGSGGGGGTPDAGIVLAQVEVTTQPDGPLSPFGSTQGGDEVILTGDGFAVGLSVHFGSVAGTVTRIETGKVTVLTPAGREGLVDITITLSDGSTSTFDDAFRYVAPPVVTGLVVQSGPTAGEQRVPIAGGDTVELQGGNFKPGMGLVINGRSVALTIVDDAHCTFVTPASDTEVSYDIRVTNPEGLGATLPLGLVYTQEFSLAPELGAFTPLRARHLFRRAAFGATPARIDVAVAAGLPTTVDGLMNYTDDAAIEAEALPLWGLNAPPYAPYNNRVALQWWIHLLLKNPNPFQERLAWFLHDHFAISNVNFAGDAQFYFYYYVNLLRRFSMATTDGNGGGPGLGYDWKKMLVEMGKDRAMLEWLDGRLSVRGNPNENYARELWELFGLGEGNGYTEADIQEAAKAFTGFQWFRDQTKFGDTRLEMRYRLSRHDERDKTIFGVTGKFGYDDIGGLYWDESAGDYDASVTTDSRDTDGGIVALTLRERGVAASTFICRKLAAFFLYDDPHDVIVNELASDLRRFNWNLKPVIRKILVSKAMYSGRATKGQVQNPVEFVLGFMRTANVDLHPTSASTNTVRVVNELASMGQSPLQPPDVSGWPTGTAWLSSQGMIERTNFITFAIEQLDDFDTQIVPLIPPVNQRGPTQLVDHIASVLDVQLSGNARAKAIAYVTTQDSNGQTVSFAYDQNNSAHVKMKTRGLLFLIAQYHDAHQN